MIRWAVFFQLLTLQHDFFGRELAVNHALDACDAVVFGDVDGADALGVAAYGNAWAVINVVQPTVGISSGWRGTSVPLPILRDWLMTGS